MLAVVAVCSSCSGESPVCAEPQKEPLWLCSRHGKNPELHYAHYATRRMESTVKFRLSHIPIEN